MIIKNLFLLFFQNQIFLTLYLNKFLKYHPISPSCKGYIIVPVSLFSIMFLLLNRSSSALKQHNKKIQSLITALWILLI